MHLLFLIFAVAPLIIGVIFGFKSRVCTNVFLACLLIPFVAGLGFLAFITYNTADPFGPQAAIVGSTVVEACIRIVNYLTIPMVVVCGVHAVAHHLPFRQPAGDVRVGNRKVVVTVTSLSFLAVALMITEFAQLLHANELPGMIALFCCMPIALAPMFQEVLISMGLQLVQGKPEAKLSPRHPR